MIYYNTLFVKSVILCKKCSDCYCDITHYGGLRYEIEFNSNTSLWLDSQTLFRFFYKTLFIVLISILIWQSWSYLDDWLIKPGNKVIHLQDKWSETIKRVVYVLERRHWTGFPILPKQKLIKVLSNATVPYALNFNNLKLGNATVPDILSFNSDKQWKYALQYQILDKDGHLLAEQFYHHRTQVTVYQEKNTQKKQRTIFYIEPNHQPTDGRNMLINLSEFPQAARLRFRIHSAAPSVIDVAIRVYWQRTTEEYKLGYLWHRLSEKQKQALARGSIYEHQLLRDKEKHNLLRKRWTPIGLLGIAGQGYMPRDFYIHRKLEGETVHPPIQKYGVFVDALHWLTLPVLGKRVHLHFSKALPLPEQKTTIPPVTIKIKWYGHRTKQLSEHTFIWDGSEKGFEQNFAEGLLEISASQPVVMRVFLKQLDSQTEVTPSPVHSSATLEYKDKPVSYEINHHQQQATPIRVNLRRLLTVKKLSDENQIALKEDKGNQVLPFEFENISTETPCSVTYTLIDAMSKTKKTDTLPLTEPRSFYDRTKKPLWGQFEVSDKNHYYFLIPSDIVTLCLSSPYAVLLAVYNRTAGLWRKVTVPDDYYERLDRNKRQPAWFKLRPKNYEVLLQQKSILPVMIQRHPPHNEEDLEILAGRYSWEDYKPVNQYLSRYILTPKDSKLPIRDQALGVYYQEIPLNRLVKLPFVNPRRTIRPNLIYLRSSKRPVPIRIMLDNRLYYKG